MTRTATFAREQLRTPFTLVLLVAVSAIFVAAALAAGWAVAFVSGSLGFFQATSSRGADRRLALAGAGARRVAVVADSVTAA